MSASDHDEVQVGGELTEDRLRAIMVRGFLLRNFMVSEAEVFGYKANPGWVDVPDADGCVPWSEFGGTQHIDGETPTLHEWKDEDGRDSIDLHIGCGEICGVLASFPYDPDCGGPHRDMAEAVLHAGRDLIDLTREVVRLRELLAHVRLEIESLRNTGECADDFAATLSSIEDLAAGGS